MGFWSILHYDHNVTTIIRPMGFWSILHYDHNVTTIIRPMGFRSILHYDHNVTTIIRPSVLPPKEGKGTSCTRRPALMRE